jgi:hypothetical protein
MDFARRGLNDVCTTSLVAALEGWTDDFAYRTAATADQIRSIVERPSFRRVGFGRALRTKASRPAEV